MNGFISYLNQYISLSDEEVSIVSNMFKPKSFEKGEYILECGDVCRHQTYIVSGKARTFSLDKMGNEHILMFAIENWWVGDLNSFENQMPAQFSIQCLGPTDTLQVHFDDFETLLQEVPKMERFFRIILGRGFANMWTRLIRNNAMTAKERYLLFCEEYPDFMQRVPLYMIASYLGITKEHLSSIRSEKL